MAVSNANAHPSPDRNKQFVIQHFDDFVNRRDLDAIDRNMTEDFLDHDGPGGQPTGRAGDREMMAKMHQALPDLHVDVRDALADGDRVVVRNVWTATDAGGRRIEFHGFVEWRVAPDGRIAERWATVTAPHELAAPELAW